jgi:hypothetical protein
VVDFGILGDLFVTTAVTTGPARQVASTATPSASRIRARTSDGTSPAPSDGETATGSTRKTVAVLVGRLSMCVSKPP